MFRLVASTTRYTFSELKEHALLLLYEWHKQLIRIKYLFYFVFVSKCVQNNFYRRSCIVQTLGLLFLLYADCFIICWERTEILIIIVQLCYCNFSDYKVQEVFTLVYSVFEWNMYWYLAYFVFAIYANISYCVHCVYLFKKLIFY